MPPPLPPTQVGVALVNTRPDVNIELFLDLICPFSKKMFCTLYEAVLPKLAGKPVTMVINQVVQPWHPQGTYVHEAALAVKQVAPTAYPAYLKAIFDAFDAGKFKSG